jgi:uncharacterized protein YciI
MTAEIPPGVAVETIFIVEATYAPDASESRRPVRIEHLSRVIELRDAGILIEAGGYADLSSALLLFRTATADEALRICREDIYTRSGVWIELRARPWGRVVREAELPATAN